MRFLVDAQLPPELAAWLSAAGHEAQHISSLGMAGAEDAQIWQKALEFGAFVVTKVADFFAIFQANAATPRQAGVIWLRLGNTRTQRLLEVMASLMPEIESLARQGELFIEVGEAKGAT
jgi:predicted nuclease of predicted toxin-antitoxin system